MLITRRTQTIGALLPDLYGEFFSELIRGIDLPRGHAVCICWCPARTMASPTAAAALRTMQGRVDGLLIMSARAMRRSCAPTCRSACPPCC